jgi:hypothetical protein
MFTKKGKSIFFLKKQSMSRVEELNERIYSRNQGDVPAFYFSPRPVATKYTTMPIIEERTIGKDISCKPIFNTTKHFLPGSKAPWSGKANTIDIETQLYRPRQYFPSSQSDLYQVKTPSTNDMQPHPHLFESVRTSDNGIKARIPEKQFFYNDTRIKNIS